VRIQDAKTKKPLASVAVGVDSTILGAMSNSDGLASVNDVPPGEHALTTKLLGYRDAHLTRVVVREGFITDVGTILLYVAEIHLDRIDLYDGPSH
jgi:hypothetical protein